LADLCTEEREELIELEKKLSWQDIIKLREWSLIELRIEAKRFMMSTSEIKHQSKNLIDIWAYCVNPEEIKLAATKEREYKRKDQIELSSAEKSGLYELLAMDKNRTMMSFMDGEFHQEQSIMTEIKLYIESVYVLFAELKTDELRVENQNRVNKFLELYSDQSEAANLHQMKSKSFQGENK
jgi:hypothetical protein